MLYGVSWWSHWTKTTEDPKTGTYGIFTGVPGISAFFAFRHADCWSRRHSKRNRCSFDNNGNSHPDAARTKQAMATGGKLKGHGERCQLHATRKPQFPWEISLNLEVFPAGIVRIRLSGLPGIWNFSYCKFKCGLGVCFLYFLVKNIFGVNCHG